MTFYEAALRILEEAGSPLHSLEITKRSLDKALLSHVGKTPEVTMLSRLAAMAKRSRERKIMVTARDTFALTDWMLPEDDSALAASGTPEINPEEDLPPMRPLERHPEPRAEYLRSIGRQAERKRRGDEDGRRKKYPPVSEVAFEVLSEGMGALVPSELLARMKTRELVQDDLGVGSMLEFLASDNQQRVDQNRRPQFAAIRVESGELQLSVDAGGPVPEGGAGVVELQQAFCTAAQLPFENGRVVLRSQRVRAGVEASAPAVESGEGVSADDQALFQTAKSAVRDARRAMARVFRKKLLELESGTFEKACIRLLHGLHFRELKVARRSKEGPLLTARRKDGSLELRYAIRLLKHGSLERRTVQELRRDLSHHGAQLGLIIGAGEVRGDARSEATSSGALVMLWCGDALADKFFEAEVGVSVTRVELFDLDEAFFVQAKSDAEEASKRREERHKERHGDRPEPRASGDARASGDSSVTSDSAATPPMHSSSDSHLSSDAAAALPPPLSEEGDEGEEGDDEDDAPTQVGGISTSAGGEPGAAGEGGKRRRRRRRRRRGGAGGAPGPAGSRPEGSAAATATAPARQLANSIDSSERSDPPAQAPEPALPPPPSSPREPSNEGGSGTGGSGGENNSGPA